MKRDGQSYDEWDLSESPQHFYVKEKPAYAIQFSDVEAMKEKFAKLLLGEDVTGGCKGQTTALALSNGITNLAAMVFGELWKLEPLPEARKSKWRKEMDWLLSPTNYMVELVPAKQNGANGWTMEETLDSMVNTEFWYAEGGSRAEEGSRAEGRNNSGRQSKRWWLPLPQVPKMGLSDTERKKLLHQGRLIHQVFKAAKSINENVLLEILCLPFNRHMEPHQYITPHKESNSTATSSSRQDQKQLGNIPHMETQATATSWTVQKTQEGKSSNEGKCNQSND